jgi:hypothetical protein
VMWVKWNLVSVRLEIVLTLAQGSSTICFEYTTGMENFLAALDGPPR